MPRTKEGTKPLLYLAKQSSHSGIQNGKAAHAIRKAKREETQKQTVITAVEIAVVAHNTRLAVLGAQVTGEPATGKGEKRSRKQKQQKRKNEPKFRIRHLLGQRVLPNGCCGGRRRSGGRRG
jgi:hypothetical protein